jgi:hypothetical protein
MAWVLTFDGDSNKTWTVSSDVYDLIDWGNGVEDSVQFTCVDGCEVTYKLDSVISIVADGGVVPGPGSYPGWEILAVGKTGSILWTVDNDTKEAIADAISGPGSEDAVVTFMSLDGPTVRVLTKNLEYIQFSVDELVIQP